MAFRPRLRLHNFPKVLALTLASYLSQGFDLVLSQRAGFNPQLLAKTSGPQNLLQEQDMFMTCEAVETTLCSVQKTYLRLLTIGLALARASAQLQDSNIPPTGRVAGGDTLSPSVL